MLPEDRCRQSIFVHGANYQHNHVDYLGDTGFETSRTRLMVAHRYTQGFKNDKGTLACVPRSPCLAAWNKTL